MEYQDRGVVDFGEGNRKMMIINIYPYWIEVMMTNKKQVHVSGNKCKFRICMGIPMRMKEIPKEMSLDQEE